MSELNTSLAKALSRRQRYDLLVAQMRNDRASFKSYWRDLSKYILPRRSRFFIGDINKGERRNLDIIDSTASLASRTLSSGMMTGVTSPARKWFTLTTDNDELNDSAAVKEYLSIVEEKLRSIFLRSNLYNVLPTLYGDLGTFATGCIFIEEDMESTVNFTSFLIGSYMISNDKRGNVRTFFREFQMTVRQIVEKFAMLPNGNIVWDNVSNLVKEQWERDLKETKIDIGHLVNINDEHKPDKIESKYKKYRSSYYELGTSSTQAGTTIISNDKFLSEKGYDYFPVMAVRWEVAGEDTYGTNSPGMMCLGDVKQLQLGEKRILTAVDQKVMPSMVGPTSLKSAKASLLPGDITYMDEREAGKSFRRLFDINFDIRELEQKQDQVRQRVSRCFYEDLFLMLANTGRAQITAREVDERHEEKLLALGPVLERINQDLLDPLVEITFQIAEKQGLLPPAPEELANESYVIKYVSIMAQAQKFAGIGHIDRLMGYVGQVSQLDPMAAQKVNVVESVDEYGKLIGINPKLIRSKDEMDELKEQQEAAQAAEAEAMQQQGQIDAAKTLSETKVDEDNALTQMLSGGEDVG